MTNPPSRIVLFAFTYHWLILALVLFSLGFLGVLLVASTTILEADVISVASGICFFLSAVCSSIWLYALAHQYKALPALQSDNIKELAIKKLVIVLGTTTFFGDLLFLLFFMAALATPVTAPIAKDFLLYVLPLEVLTIGAIVGLFFLTRNRLLAYWFPVLICPHCQEQTTLVNYWYCVGGCRTLRPRHVLSPCPTCATRLQGLACSNYNCGQAISFEAPYNEFEVANRNNKYVTQYNPFFWGAVLALIVSLFLFYVSFATDFIIFCGMFGMLSLALVITLIVVKPKRLTRNPYYTEGAQQWTRSATA
jgi:hypothetical protein